MKKKVCDAKPAHRSTCHACFPFTSRVGHGINYSLFRLEIEANEMHVTF